MHIFPNLQPFVEPAWQPCEAVYQLGCPDLLKPWLLDSGSLTSRLIRLSHGNFRVSVLQQALLKPRRSECARLAKKPRRLALIREVTLFGNDSPWVFARTIIPLSTLTGRLRSLRRLDNRPLGALLFADPHMERGGMEVVRLSGKEGILPRQLQPAKEPVFGRRSVFFLDKKPLLVNEFFLPPMLQALADHKGS